MNREQMEAHLSLLGWRPQTDALYYHITNTDLDLCAYTLKQGITDVAYISVLDAKYGATDGDFNGSWQAIPDVVLAAMFEAAQERKHELFT